MSNYDEAIKIVDKIYNKTDFTKDELQPLIDYLNKSETTEKEHEALKRDVARYFDNLKVIDDYKHSHPNKTNKELEISLEKEVALYRELFGKLSKVGKEE